MLRNFFDQPLLLLVLVLIIVVVFGAKRLPDAARSLGRSMRIFKSEVKEMKDDGKPSTSSTPGTPGTPTRPLEGRVLGDDVPHVDRTTTTSTTTTSTPSSTDTHRSGA